MRCVEQGLAHASHLKRVHQGSPISAARRLEDRGRAERQRGHDRRDPVGHHTDQKCCSKHRHIDPAPGCVDAEDAPVEAYAAYPCLGAQRVNGVPGNCSAGTKARGQAPASLRSPTLGVVVVLPAIPDPELSPARRLCALASLRTPSCAAPRLQPDQKSPGRSNLPGLLQL